MWACGEHGMEVHVLDLWAVMTLAIEMARTGTRGFHLFGGTTNAHGKISPAGLAVLTISSSSSSSSAATANPLSTSGWSGNSTMQQQQLRQCRHGRRLPIAQRGNPDLLRSALRSASLQNECEWVGDRRCPLQRTIADFNSSLASNEVIATQVTADDERSCVRRDSRREEKLVDEEAFCGRWNWSWWRRVRMLNLLFFTIFTPKA